jgi:hypothetical protein
MSALSRRAAEVEHELGAEWTRYHVGAQVTRFLVGVLAAALWSMHSGFSDWTDLVPLLGTAAWTTAAQMWPQVPWSLLREHFASGPDKAPAPTPVPPADPTPSAKG